MSQFSGCADDRLEGCQRDVEVWQRILQLRSLVLSPSEDIDTWITFVDLCRTSDRLNLAEKTLTALVGQTPHMDAEDTAGRAPPPIIFAVYRLEWAKHNRDNSDRVDRVNTLNQLRQFTADLEVDVGLGGPRQNRQALIMPNEPLYGDYKKLLAKCYVELGQWQAAMRGEEGISDDPGPIIADYATATRLDTDWYQAWHTWALANFEVITQLEVSPQGLQSMDFETYIVPAVQGELSIRVELINRLLAIYCAFAWKCSAGYPSIAHSLVPVWISVWGE